MKPVLRVFVLLGFLFSLMVSPFLFATENSQINVRAIQAQAQSETQKGNHVRAVELLRQTLKAAPNSMAIKMNLSQALTDRANQLFSQKQMDAAVAHLHEAVAVEPKNGPAWFFLGDIAYLNQNNFQTAVSYWKKALPLAPAQIQKQINERISRAEIDRHLEQGYVSFSTTHFEIRFSKDVPKKEVSRVGDYLEAEYAKFSTELNMTPPKLTLIIYPKQSFDRITGSHDETLGLYDGRIRIGSRELNSKYESTILSHELAHAFLQHAFGSGLPIWIQEGYAQSKEPVRFLTTEEKRIEAELIAGTGWIPLKWLDRRFTQPSNLEDVTRSYLQSRLVIAYLLKKGVGSAFQQFLTRISKGEALKSAFEASFKGISWNSIEYGRFSA